MKPNGGSSFKIRSIWTFDCHSKCGKLRWSKRNTNLVTNQGLNALLNVMFHGATQITTWYIALIESDSTLNAGNTYDTPGVTECTAYDETSRVVLNEAAASGQSMTNSANKASFTMNASKTIYGGMLVGGGTAAATKGDTAGGGTLYCQVKFDSPEVAIAEDILKITVTLEALDGGA